MREAQDRTNAQVNTNICRGMGRRIAAVVMSVAVTLVLLFSTLYLVEEADHDCTGEDCVHTDHVEGAPEPLKSLFKQWNVLDIV